MNPMHRTSLAAYVGKTGHLRTPEDWQRYLRAEARAAKKRAQAALDAEKACDGVCVVCDDEECVLNPKRTEAPHDAA